MLKRITLSTQDQIYFVVPNDILYCKCNNTSTTFYLNNQPSIVISKGIKAVAEMLSDVNFIRPHQSYLVNKNQIVRVDKVDDYHLVLSNNERIPISIRRRKAIMEILKINK
jgi:two-component system LytT family response regulator